MKVFDYLLIFVPASLVLGYAFHAQALWVFACSLAGIVPLADWIRRGTEQIAKSVGPAAGGLLNVTFGNFSELILAFFVLRIGRGDVVKAQITGSIIGNSLLGLGIAILVGSLGRPHQNFSKERAGLLSSLLVVTVIALLLPALFDYTERAFGPEHNVRAADERLSLGVSSVLILVYFANLVYTLLTHRDAFAFEADQSPAMWSTWTSLGILVLGTALLALEAELVSRSMEVSAKRLGLSPFFLGMTILAVVGNAAEYVSASYFARKDRMGLALSISVGSTVQVALLIAPLLVFGSLFVKHPMNLVFGNGLELIAIASTAFIVSSIARDGRTTWFEGLLLVAVYILLVLAFLFATPEAIPS